MLFTSLMASNFKLANEKIKNSDSDPKARLQSKFKIGINSNTAVVLILYENKSQYYVSNLCAIYII